MKLNLLRLVCFFWNVILMLLIAAAFSFGSPVAGVILLIVFGAFQYTQGDTHIW